MLGACAQTAPREEKNNTYIDGTDNVSDILENALGAVVTVAVYKTMPVNRQLGSRGADSGFSKVAYQKALDLLDANGSGSGFLVEKDGKKYVITNAHVVEMVSTEPESLFIFTYDREKYEVRVLGGDSFYDIAVLEILDPLKDNVNTLAFATEEARIGEKVFAIGNPGGDYPYTVTDGIVSAKNRVRGGLTGKFGFLQTTATVIWGNSGGPLINERGEVVGINSQIAFTNAPDGEPLWLSQINFALEASLSNRLVDDIINNDGRVARAYLGLEISQRYQTITSRAGRGLRKMDNQPVISNILPRSPASFCCMDLVGSTILAIDGEEVSTLEEALGVLEGLGSEEAVAISYEIDGRQQSTTINAISLGTQQLETIAAHFLEQIEEIDVDYNAPFVSFSLDQDPFYQGQGKTYQKPQNSTNSTRKFAMVAAGVTDHNQEQMWLTASLSDLGAVLKLAGMTGLLDFYVMDTGVADGNPTRLRRYFSNSEYILKNTLWY